VSRGGTEGGGEALDQRRQGPTCGGAAKFRKGGSRGRRRMGAAVVGERVSRRGGAAGGTWRRRHAANERSGRDPTPRRRGRAIVSFLALRLVSSSYVAGRRSRRWRRLAVAAAAWLVSLLSLRSLHGLGSVAIGTVTRKGIDWVAAHVTTLFCCGLMYRSVGLRPINLASPTDVRWNLTLADSLASRYRPSEVILSLVWIHRRSASLV
jgi:hypothetical protein